MTFTPTITDTPVPLAIANAGEDVALTPTVTRTLAPPVDAAQPLPSALPSLDAAIAAGTGVALAPQDAPGTGTAPSIPAAENRGVPIELLIGASVLLLVLVYGASYLRGVVTADRYDGGFVIDVCPVCKRGTLELEERTDRVVGVPRVKRTVRCTACRSVLREVGSGRWRYAIDPMENPNLYSRLNGRIVSDDTLRQLAGRTFESISPEFIDEEGTST